MTDIYQDITDRIVAALEQGVAPWIKPWATQANGLIPHNAVSGRAYNGVNFIILSCAPYASNGWLTYKQAKELGGNVRKGEKGTQIVFWSFPKITDKETGEVKTVPFAKGFTVFNVEQCEGLDMAKVKGFTPAAQGATAINALAASAGADVRHGGGSAYYNPSSDFIAMPAADTFVSEEAYAGTLAHELVHWTGHKDRCDRAFGKRFGDDAYAFEELVAEIGSAFVCASSGIPLENLQHENYIASWLKVLKTDKRAIFTASSQAKKAADWLFSATQEQDQALAA